MFDPLPLLLGDSATTGTPRSVTVADMDGDGDPDIVSANQASDTLTVFYNAHGP